MITSFTARRAVRVSEPAGEPVSLSEAKVFLRIDGSDEDALLTELIKAARIAAEQQMGKSLITQSWQLRFDGSAPAIVALPYAPVQTVTSVKRIDEQDNETLLSASHYYVNSVLELVFRTVPFAHRVVVEYVAGFGDEPGDVPTDMVQAILLHVAHLYEHRDSMTPPLASQLCYSQHREVRL